MAVDVDRTEFDALQALVNQLQGELATLQTQVNNLPTAGATGGAFTRADDGDQISGSENTGGAGEPQHLLLEVSDFQGAGDNEPMNTFLHLGAADASPSGERAGDDLIEKAFFNPEDRDQSGRSGELNLRRDLERPFDDDANDRVDEKALFIDDIRKGASEDQVDIHGDGLVATRVKSDVSAEIKTRGGWRDHSDGNRISTTRGDKVEVIRGNYKLVVLGRQDDPENGFEVDASGGIVQDSDITPGGIYEVKVVPDGDTDRFKVVEFADRGDLHTVFNGPVLEEYRGEFVSHWGSRFHLTPKWEEKIFSSVIFSEENAGVIHHQYAAGLMTEMWAGPFIETFGGLNTTIAVGGSVDLTFGVDASVTVGMNVSVTMGPFGMLTDFDYLNGKRLEMLTGERTEVVTGKINEYVMADWTEICAEDHTVITRHQCNISMTEHNIVAKEHKELKNSSIELTVENEKIMKNGTEMAIEKESIAFKNQMKALRLELGF